MRLVSHFVGTGLIFVHVMFLRITSLKILISSSNITARNTCSRKMFGSSSVSVLNYQVTTVTLYCQIKLTINLTALYPSLWDAQDQEASTLGSLTSNQGQWVKIRNVIQNCAIGHKGHDSSLLSSSWLIYVTCLADIHLSGCRIWQGHIFVHLKMISLCKGGINKVM